MHIAWSGAALAAAYADERSSFDMTLKILLLEERRKQSTTLKRFETLERVRWTYDDFVAIRERREGEDGNIDGERPERGYDHGGDEEER